MDQKQPDSRARRVIKGGEADQRDQRQGDNRTPDKTIGQVTYADNKTGSEPQKDEGSTSMPGVEKHRTPRHHPGQQKPVNEKTARKSQTEGPAAYAPHQEDEDIRAFPDREPVKKKTGEF